jgi:hypothetical protein
MIQLSADTPRASRRWCPTVVEKLLTVSRPHRFGAAIGRSPDLLARSGRRVNVDPLTSRFRGRIRHPPAIVEPTDIVAMPVEISDDIAVESVEVKTLPADWRTFPPPPALAVIGDQWFRASRTAVLSVPSVVIPHERNFVLNPTHREFAQLSIGRQSRSASIPGCGRSDAFKRYDRPKVVW